VNMRICEFLKTPPEKKKYFNKMRGVYKILDLSTEIIAPHLSAWVE